jgi:hypothetical protein
MNVVRRLFVVFSLVVMAGAMSAIAGASDPTFSGQVFFSGGSVEPAINDADGSTVYLLTPKNAPTNANREHAVAPLYLPAYPLASTLPSSDFNCQPTNCDHVPVVPAGVVNGFGLSSVYPLGNQHSPFFPGCEPLGCFGGLYKGHDHLVGIKPTGDFNVAWHVYLLAFTPKAVADGVINTRITTLQQIQDDVANGYLINTMPPQGPDNPTGAVGIDTGIIFSCASVSSNVYTQHLG